jgi:hypothetical protein
MSYKIIASDGTHIFKIPTLKRDFKKLTQNLGLIYIGLWRLKK